ncbi:hypothetical protein AVEN_111013-1 [Araneus ventricosus]|uniref:Uncharacterized protein n=1 Tax=Araneus ventricosus TaxID=182803 RepID=A0A4Y2DXN0_ARAVE|nr:hypothetical protein AVEN_247676-1 [Araneus ventricosus]GBM20789.1 hypothetical protein AVEN_111013-1 [Araneus ventricosus]
MSVCRRPDLRSQRPKSIFFITQENRALARFRRLSKIPSPRYSILALFLTLIFLPLGERSENLSTNSRQFCRWSVFQRPIIGSLPLGPFPCRKWVLWPINHFHICHSGYFVGVLTSGPLLTGWTLGSLCRRFNEMSVVDRLDSPPRHLLCSVTHGMGKSY